MKKQAFNPYLPSYEYVPDGEPYVFDDRLYVFGSHDAFGGSDFCVNDYVCWSAPVSDLGDWRYEGTIWSSINDPISKGKKTGMNAPDVVRGADGRYYLFYQLMMQKVTTVLVADNPEGPYQLHGHVKYPDGTLYGTRKGDPYCFDPAVLLDDDGQVYMYTGSVTTSKLLHFMMKLGGGVCDSGTVIRMEQDMLTVVPGSQKSTIPGPFVTQGTGFEGHGFFEASSIRKINGRYYLVYSSEVSHDLCYATSDSPVGPWKYGGILVSIGDIGLNGNTQATNYLGNTHGGMVEVNGQWYIFYHRQTNKQKCCRQGCAEKIYFDENGHIPQVEITSCGLNDGPLKGEGTYEARIACNLGYTEPCYGYLKTHEKDTLHPYFTQSGEDRENNGDQYIANMRNGAWAGFKYFDFCGETKISVKVRGDGKGKLLVSTSRNGSPVAEISLDPSAEWTDFAGILHSVSGVYALYFRYEGDGYIDFSEFTLQ